jgi:hypothetical protein
MKKKLTTNKEVLWEIFMLIRINRKWWLLPFFIILALLSFFVGLTGNQTILPAIYALF